MLDEYSRFSDVNLDDLLNIYSQSLDHRSWSEVSAFIEDLQLFFKNINVYIMMWRDGAKAVAAMRLEPYRDGFLITCLETDPQHRRKGYAYQLLEAVFKKYPGIYYSHIDKRNKPSLMLHRKLGFEIILNHAVHVDGSVFSDSVTLKK